MPIIFEEDLHKYIDEEDINTQNKWGAAIYLPRGSSMIGDGFMDILGTAANWVGKNSGTIENIVGTISKVADMGINISKGVEQVKAIQELREKAKEAKAEDVAAHFVTSTEVQPPPPSVQPSTGTPRPWASFFKAQKTKGNITGQGFRIITQH